MNVKCCHYKNGEMKQATQTSQKNNKHKLQLCCVVWYGV